MSKQVKVKRYDSIYKKRKMPSGNFWKKFISVVVFVAIIGLGYVGAAKILNSQGNTTDPSSITPTESSSKDDNNDSSIQESEPSDQSSEIKAITISKNVLLDSSALDAALTDAVDKGYNSVIINYKDEDGLILYNTGVQEATTWGAVNPQTVDAQTIAQTIKDHGLTPIASLSAFIDNSAAHASRDNAITYQGNSNTTWLGGSNASTRWLNPYKEAARTYLNNIVAELNQLGYDNIMLYNVKFPATSGKYDLFDGGVSKQDILKQFITELNGTGANIIISYDWNAVTDGEMEYGGDPSGYGAAYNAPVIDLSQYSNGLESDGQVITNSAEIISTILNKIQTNSGETEIVPMLDSQDDTIIQALSSVGITSYIVK